MGLVWMLVYLVDCYWCSSGMFIFNFRRVFCCACFIFWLLDEVFCDRFVLFFLLGILYFCGCRCFIFGVGNCLYFCWGYFIFCSCFWSVFVVLFLCFGKFLGLLGVSFVLWCKLC